MESIARQKWPLQAPDVDDFRLLVEGVTDYAIFLLGPDGRIKTWNAGAERLKGYAASEIIGKHFSIFYPPEAVQSGWPQYELEKAISDGRFEDQGWRVRKDGSRFWANVVITALHDHEGKLYGFGKVTRDFTERKRAEEELLRSEEKFRLLVEAVQDYAIFMLDTEGRVSSWNGGAERLKGYKAFEILGNHFSVFYPEEDIRANKPQRELKIAVEQGRVEDEGWRVRKDGSRFWANVVITALRNGAGELIGFAKVTRDFTERRITQQALQESEKRLRELSLHLLRTQDEERRRIGRDLHDSLGQYLGVLKMKLDVLAPLGDPELALRDAAACSHLVEQCIKEVRTISYLLYPPMLEEMGLKSAISWYLDGFTKRSGIQTVLKISPDFQRLANDVELAMFRVLQESLTNVHRHSGSPTAQVDLSVEHGYVTLEIRDQGAGLPSTAEEPGPDWLGALGVGLRGMRERMQQVGGSLEVISKPQGTTVKARAPNQTIDSTEAASVERP
jgi:PAS domain S-box-containing protein